MKDILKNIVYFIFQNHLIRFGNKASIYLTFDDGPHKENTPMILDILDKKGVKATFFMTGVEMEKHIDIVKDIAARGHQLGYHSYTHMSMKHLKLNDFIIEMKKVDAICKEINCNIRLFRPPYGDLSFLCVIWLIFNDWKIVMWSLDSRDSFDDKHQVLRNVSPERLRPGEILLFHDDYILTIEILPEILSRLNDSHLSCAKLT